jgi:hypothetical protein
MKNMKFFAAILVFGSLWGISECLIGSLLRDANLPAGALMTGIFALGLMTLSRVNIRRPGMQAGMGLVAGSLRILNPFGGCFLCSAIAIMAEGILFDLLWTGFGLDNKDTRTMLNQASFGVSASYIVYIGGYFVTQILTPVFSSAGFYFENLLAFLPQILASGLLAALIGVITVPAMCMVSKLDITVKDRLYYPITLGVSAVCWIIVITNTIFILWF